MRVLVLGQGKTGKVVAQVAAEHGHGVHVLDAKENRDASALTPPFVAGFDVVLGPLLTLVIANPAKPRRELVRDIAIIVCVQSSSIGGLNETAIAFVVKQAIGRAVACVVVGNGIVILVQA